MPALTDSDFVTAFEACALSNEDFHHRDHVRLAWLYLKDLPPEEALARFATGLRRFAHAHGKPGLYHETITWAYLLLIRERMARTAADTFEEFAAAHPDLLTWKPSVLESYYRAETLRSELARRVFVMPDRIGGEPAEGSGPGTRAREPSATCIRRPPPCSSVIACMHSTIAALLVGDRVRVSDDRDPARR
ncbi:MAG TPA: hypothetical protein VFE33_03625 [Thermoanaerobaculia bacterium]|nr:hypothetical protein [Thermoanaerobaculia bacterium]